MIAWNNNKEQPFGNPEDAQKASSEVRPDWRDLKTDEADALRLALSQVLEQPTDPDLAATVDKMKKNQQNMEKDALDKLRKKLKGGLEDGSKLDPERGLGPLE